ncbi:MAG: Eco57I restriction-modification methylase domain-containing protein [Desulfobacteraceae bacterium]|nr:Eco57I restriction-modification methylase domain-containing protein [Desulfobacteraceae bacterium]
MDLKIFADTNLFEAGIFFFNQLKVPLNSNTTTPLHLKDILKDKFKSQEIFEKVSATYFLGLVDKSVFDTSLSLFDDGNVTFDQAVEKIHADYEGMMIFAVQIDGIDSPTRTQLSDLTRAFNRASKNLPVVVLFQYGDFLTLATSERTKYKQTWREGEKIGKISLLKDIDTLNTHAGHNKILNDLVLKPGVLDFSGLYKQWREVFDVQLLNRNFYKELSNWYFWALRKVEFPDDTEKNKEIRNSTSVIRLITRLIFVWFLKEKRLVPEILFNKKALDKYLKYDDINNSTYYKAILQNLFFATLNTKMKKDDPQSRKFVNRQSGIQQFYRYQRFFKDKQNALKLFENIPFLNGGLFENLDKNTGEPNEKRIDCFSNRPVHEKKLKVPDRLFFGDEEIIDISKEFGTEKPKNEKVRGLIHILNSYKFTIDENTPIEEEIALDPELLGKVFENLLASYNPETKTTARKQTGSFYTPREIVDYMVDESLKASLSNLVSKKIDNATEDDIKTGLDILFEYTEKEHAFTDNEVSKIVEAISELKILDPACGSGAFPMGILHKLVFILNKIDGDNKKWRELQKQRAIKETENAYNLGDKEERHQRLKEIEEAFDFNTSDYGRKLFLIENSIYGVDIQPIAVQIAKLRFFISLIVDQNTDEDKENLGILPLPNLETKFVAANTLIEIEKGLGNLFELKIKEKERELAKVRQKHFSARTPKTKATHREKDKQLRSELAQLLCENENFGTGVAEQLAHWDPYDQNNSAEFFDMEWMFGVSDGFDIVIGNPPYVRADNPAISKQRKLILASKYYDTLWEKWDLMVPFFERGLKILRHGGGLIYISSDAITTSKYALKLQDWIIKNHFVKCIDYFENIKVFDAGVTPVVIMLQNSTKSKTTLKKIRTNSFENINIIEIDNEDNDHLRQKIFKKSFSELFYPNIQTERLGDICYISYGLRPNSDERYWQGEFSKKDVISDSKNGKYCKEYIEGKNIKAYQIEKIQYLEWGTDRVPEKLVRPTFPALYIGDKILRGRVTKGTFDNTGIVCNDSIIVFKRFIDLQNVNERSISVSISKNNIEGKGGNKSSLVEYRRAELEEISKNYSLKYILAIINSEYAMAFLNNFRRHRMKNYFYPDDFRNFPIPKIIKSDQEPFIRLADNILAIKKTNSSADTTALETEIDARVAHLYNLTEEEYSLILKATNCSDPFRVAALNVYRDISRGKIK